MLLQPYRLLRSESRRITAGTIVVYVNVLDFESLRINSLTVYQLLNGCHAFWRIGHQVLCNLPLLLLISCHMGGKKLRRVHF